MKFREKPIFSLSLVLLFFCSEGCGLSMIRLDPRLGVTPTPAPALLTSPLPSQYTGGNQFLNYLRNDGTRFWNASGTPCDGTETVWSACLDTGEYLKFPLPSSVATSCLGITGQDSLGIFRWTCQMVSSVPTLLSYGFLPGKGIKDTLSVDGLHFKNLGLSISRNGTLIATNADTSVWTNTLTALPDNSSGPDVDLAGAAGTIYTLTTSRVTYGYTLIAPNLALVTLPGVELTLSPSSAINCDSSSGPNPAGDMVSAVCAGQYLNQPQAFIWVEANINCNSVPQSAGAFGYSASLSTWRAMTVRNCTYDGFALRYSDGSQLRSVTSYSNTGSGFYFQAGTAGAMLSEVVAYSNGNNGLGTDGSLNNGIIKNSYFVNNSAEGLYVSTDNLSLQNNIVANNDIGVDTYSSTNLIFTQTTSVSNNTMAVHNAGSTVDFLFSTFANNGDGIQAYVDLTDTLYSNVISANNAEGIYGNHFLGNIQNAAFVNNDIGIDPQGSYGINLMGSTLVGHNGSGDCSAGSNVTVGTCTGSGANASTDWSQPATLYTTRTSVGAFVGKVASDTVAGSATALASAITDWSSFANVFRVWGLLGTPGNAYADSTQRGFCTGGANCQIWDWSLLSGASDFLNRSDDGINANAVSGTLVNGSPCPAAVNGNKITTDYWGHTFLTNAYEIIDDPALNPTGNNNGLCESGEACVYAANLGAYQGSGDYTQVSCAFTAGTVSGVTIYGFPVNGN